MLNFCIADKRLSCSISFSRESSGWNDSTVRLRRPDVGQGRVVIRLGQSLIRSTWRPEKALCFFRDVNGICVEQQLPYSSEPTTTTPSKALIKSFLRDVT